MATIGRKDLLLLLVGLSADGKPDDQVNGVTRLQKFLFLLQKEQGLDPSGDGFSFTPWKAGPYSSKVYDDLEFLENLGLLEADTVAEATEAEASEAAEAEREFNQETDFRFEDLMGSDQTRSSSSIFEERRFRLSKEGVKRVRDLLANDELKPVAEGIRRIKSKYSRYSLNDLLYHVYTAYPEFTVASEIKDKVLSRGRP